MRSGSSHIWPGVVLASLVLVACGGESGNRLADEWRATLDTVGDTITVRTLSGSVWGDNGLAVLEAREEERRIGVMPMRYAEAAAFDVFAPDGR